MIKPSLHLNGSDPKVLRDGYRAAAEAVSKAIDLLVTHASPNARDYYPQGDNAARMAVAEHTSRVQRLQAIENELTDLALHCAKGR